MRRMALAFGMLLPFALVCVATPLRGQVRRLYPISALPVVNTPAFLAIARLHRAELARLPQPDQGGIWLVQDSTGHLISSGVLKTFPAAISSSDYAEIVPVVAKLQVLAFGLARTPVIDGAGPFRVAFVTVASLRQGASADTP